MKYTIILFLLVIFTGCTSNDLKNDLNLDIFISPQQEVLKAILKKNDSIMMSLNNTLSISDAYLNHVTEIHTLMYEHQKFRNSFIRSIEFCKRLDEYEILKLHPTRTRVGRTKKYVSKLTYGLNFFSSYMSYLQLLGRNNETIRNYRERVLSQGDITFAGYDLMKDLTLEDLKDENVRLVIGVHYLIVNSRR